MKSAAQIIRGWKEQQEKSFRIVAFGSSNTELSWHSEGRHNWVDWLYINIRGNLGRHITVVNQGISGETSEDLLKRMERDVFSLSPQAVIITVGGNDAARGFTYRQYYDNLKEICTRLIDKKIQPILQTYYCPYYDECSTGYRDIFESFAEVNRNLAGELDIPLIDQYAYFEPFYEKDKAGYKELMRDGLHVNPLGNMIMGIIVSKHFGLPEPQIPGDIKAHVDRLLEKLYFYSGK